MKNHIIFDLDSLIHIYKWLMFDPLVTIKSDLNIMLDLIGKLKFKNIQNHSDYNKIKWLSEMSIKKVRKPLLGIDFDSIKLFNETLKIEYPNKKWIQNIHTKEHWLCELLIIIKNKSRNLLYDIEHICGYNSYEKNRLESNHFIVKQGIDYNTYYFNSYDINVGVDFTDKNGCICIKDVLGDTGYFIFKSGERYQYRIKYNNSEIYVYEKEVSAYIFESDTFYEYFISPESRDRKLIELGI